MRDVSNKPYIAICAISWFVLHTSNDREGTSECCGLPLKPKYGLTPISCHTVLEKSGCAPFIKERRMELY